MSNLPKLSQIFPGPDIGKIVDQFDFSKMSIHDVNAQDYLHVNLAPSYGKLNSDAIKSMDDQMKVMIAATVKMIGDIKPADRSWEKIVSTLLQNPVLQPDGEGVRRADSLVKNSSSDFKFDGSPDAAIVREVNEWFKNLIGDDNVLKDTSININDVAGIVAQTGATVDSFEAFWAKHEYHEKSLLDIGVLRFPDLDRPYFQVYRIYLKAWSDSQRILWSQEDHNGIAGEYNSQNYKPRPSVIQQMSQPAIQKAAQMADALFS